MVIKVCEDANKLSVASSTCPECDARQINVEYRPVKISLISVIINQLASLQYKFHPFQEKNKLANGLTKVKDACIFCSPELSELVEKRYASHAKSKRGGGRGRGRGRGRGSQGVSRQIQMLQNAVWQYVLHYFNVFSGNQETWNWPITKA